MSDRTKAGRDIPALEALREELSRVAAVDAGRPPSRGPMLIITALLVTGLVGVAVVAVLWDREEPTPLASPSEPPAPEETVAAPSPLPPGGFAGHGEAYESVAQLAKASDLIVVGTVERTRVASEIGEGPDDPFPTRLLHTLVIVEEVLKGSEGEEPAIVATDELGFQGPGIEDWREPERRVLLFLTRSREKRERYVPVGFAYPQAAYFVDGQQIEMTIGGDVNRLSERIAAMTLPEIRDRVRAASS